MTTPGFQSQVHLDHELDVVLARNRSVAPTKPIPVRMLLMSILTGCKGAHKGWPVESFVLQTSSSWVTESALNGTKRSSPGHSTLVPKGENWVLRSQGFRGTFESDLEINELGLQTMSFKATPAVGPGVNKKYSPRTTLPVQPRYGATWVDGFNSLGDTGERKCSVQRTDRCRKGLATSCLTRIDAGGFIKITTHYCVGVGNVGYTATLSKPGREETERSTNLVVMAADGTVLYSQ